MLNKIIRIIVHPIFIYLVIASLECRPYFSSADQTIYKGMPQVGDNFRASNEDTVYYFSGQGKYVYSSSACYFELGNPSYSASIKQGGIRIVEASVAKKIPLLGDMCKGDLKDIKQEKEITKKASKDSFKRYLSFNFLIDNFSNIAHVLCYLLLACSLLHNLYHRKTKYLIAFIGCFLGGAILEGIQHYFIIGRTASWEDQISNTFGAVIGISVFWLLDRFKFIQFLK